MELLGHSQHSPQLHWVGSGGRMHGGPAFTYSLVWPPDRRYAGPGCISTAHVGKPDPAQQGQNYVTPDAARPSIPASCTDPLAVRTPNREPADSLASALERTFLIDVENFGMVPVLPSRTKMDLKIPSVGHTRTRREETRIVLCDMNKHLAASFCRDRQT